MMTTPSTTTPVVTRFAPSPTGALHVGGARTALYAWAYARANRGKFILRFEDTDWARSDPAHYSTIVQDLRWLGLDWDEGPVRQSERVDHYNEIVERLLASGRAYEEPAESGVPEAKGAVRFRMDRNVTFEDAVFGPVTWQAESLEDFVIRKGEAAMLYPTFHLAVVADDADMGVTHVIRGQEHLANTAKHAALYDALGIQRPVWAHTPSIMNADGSKMSKRDKAKTARAAAKQAGIDTPTTVGIDDKDFQRFLNKESDDTKIAAALAQHLNLTLPEIDVDDFRRSGYLPEVLINYIALLGWNPGSDIERFNLDFLVDHFSFERMGKKNAQFDREKLAAFNQESLSELPAEEFAAKLRAHAQVYHFKFIQALGEAGFGEFARLYQPRCRTLEDVFHSGRFFIEPPSEYEAKAVKKQLLGKEQEGLGALRTFRDELAGNESDRSDWTAESIHTMLESFVERHELKNLGAIAQPLRVALTGTAVSPPIDQTLALLGREETQTRIQRCLDSVYAQHEQREIR